MKNAKQTIKTSQTRNALATEPRGFAVTAENAAEVVDAIVFAEATGTVCSFKGQTLWLQGTPWHLRAEWLEACGIDDAGANIQWLQWEDHMQLKGYTWSAKNAGWYKSAGVNVDAEAENRWHDEHPDGSSKAEREAARAERIAAGDAAVMEACRAAREWIAANAAA